MTIKNFDYYYKIIMILLLIGGIIWTCLEFRGISQKGLLCQKQPFIYGAQVMAEKYGDSGFMSCTCSLGNNETTKSYYFTQDQENPNELRGRLDFGVVNLSNITIALV